MAQELVIEAGHAERQYWKDLWRYRELFLILTWRDVAVQYKQTVVGILWAVLRPLLTMAAFTFLLKLLSRITVPTTGRITLRGRVASLLEVGTGFHPELTGRENIFLNGAILGMSRAEVRRKFDEIVDFAGVEKFLDTPVKRYSSGMYVRLAFAVAAHLEPEILIVDEVLAVGDAEFQKKCLGKMEEVGKEGRTVLFVSHNMESISLLCNKGMFLSHGTLLHDGDTQAALSAYRDDILHASEKLDQLLHVGNGDFRLTDIEIIGVKDGVVRPVTPPQKSEPLKSECSWHRSTAMKRSRFSEEQIIGIYCARQRPRCAWWTCADSTAFLTSRFTSGGQSLAAWRFPMPSACGNSKRKTLG